MLSGSFSLAVKTVAPHGFLYLSRVWNRSTKSNFKEIYPNHRWVTANANLRIYNKTDIESVMIKQISEFFWNGFFLSRINYPKFRYIFHFPQQISIWLALDPVSKETCVKYWKGSQKKRCNIPWRVLLEMTPTQKGRACSSLMWTIWWSRERQRSLNGTWNLVKVMLFTRERVTSLVESKQFFSPFCSTTFCKCKSSAGNDFDWCRQWVTNENLSLLSIFLVFFEDLSEFLNSQALNFYGMNFFAETLAPVVSVGSVITGDGHLEISKFGTVL